jgi:hypothetical protein
MPMREGDIYKILENNYQKAIKMLPQELADEFKKKIILPADLNEYTRYIYVAVQFKDETSMLRIQNWLADHFKRGNFGKKLADKGVNPSLVYEQMLKGFFDY